MRLYQDRDFEITHFNGLQIDKFIVSYDADEIEKILAIYLKIKSQKWQYFFLDAGLGFWEKLEELDIDDNLYLFKDETNRLELKNNLIHNIYCKPHGSNSRITIETLEKTIHLQCKNPKLFDDNNFEVVMESKRFDRL